SARSASALSSSRRRACSRFPTSSPRSTPPSCRRRSSTRSATKTSARSPASSTRAIAWRRRATGEDPGYARDVGLDREVLRHARSPGRAEPLAKRRVTPQGKEVAGEGFHVAMGIEKARRAVRHRFLRSDDIRADHGLAERHGFQYHAREAFLARAEDEDVHAGHDRQGVCQESEELHLVLEAELRRECLQREALGAVSDHK